MRKTLTLTDLDCANCAAKIERAVQKVDGVVSVNVNFMTQKLTLEAPDERFAAVLGETQRVIGAIQPDVRLGK